MDLKRYPSHFYGIVGLISNALPTVHRLAAWEQHNTASLVALQAAPSRRTEFVATGVNLKTPGVEVARVRCSPHKVARTEQKISEHPVQGAVVYVDLNHRGTFWHRQQRIDLLPWQVLVVDGDQPFECELQTGTDEYVFRVPRRLLAEVTSQRNFSTPTVFEAIPKHPAGQAVALLRGLATKLLTQQHQDWKGLTAKTTSLLAWILGEQPTSLFQTAQELIRQRCIEAGFDASELAAALGVSNRQLSRVSARQNRSVAREILTVRLELACGMLDDLQYASVPIADIAMICGFTSAAHFSRSYHTTYGQSPLQHRKSMRPPS